jgi:hypothetical protein
MDVFVNNNFVDHHLICELYQHEVIMSHDLKFNPTPYVGYILLQDFVSFMIHQVKWKLAHETIEKKSR